MEFIHRNGRTARMNADGTAYILKWDQEKTKDYIESLKLEPIQADELGKANTNKVDKMTTLFISGGRKDKISKGDIAGLFFKIGNLEKGELGQIELKLDCAFVAVKEDKVDDLLTKVDNVRLKKKKVRIKRI